MGYNQFSRSSHDSTASQATRGGSQSATADAEERSRRGEGLDPLIDPKGPAHLGPIRRSLPRFEKRGNFWVLTMGVPMSEETLLDTTGSMQNNVDVAFKVLPNTYEMYTTGSRPVLSGYDPQIATAIFNDVEDGPGIPVLCRTQFEMDEKISQQMTRLVPGRNGQGNGKEDPQFGIFGAAYLTQAAINQWGLKYYHFTVSDEPIVDRIGLRWLKTIFGDDVLDRVKENGFDFDVHNLPDTQQAVADLQKRAHAFFLQVHSRTDVLEQWTDLYGADHLVQIEDTQYLHCYKAVIIGLIEGVLDLNSVMDFLVEHKVPKVDANRIVRQVAHIPLGAQRTCPNYGKLPKAGDVFREKTDLWPVDLATVADAEKEEGSEPIQWL